MKLRGWVTGALCVFATSALGYILPGGSILRRMADLRDDMQLFTLRVEGNASFMGSGAKEVAAALGLAADRSEIPTDATVSLKLPLRCRVDFGSPEGGKSALILNAGKRRVDGNEVAPLTVALEEVCSLLALRSSSENESRGLLDQHLRGRGISLHKTSLARFGGKVTYVLGELTPNAAQFWVYKDGFLPARVKFTDAQGTAWDVRFLDYTSASTGEWFPRMVEVARGNETVLRFTSLKADAKSAISDKLF